MINPNLNVLLDCKNYPDEFYLEIKIWITSLLYEGKLKKENLSFG